MKRLLIVVPILFFGLKPYQQTTTQAVPTDSITQFEKDTLVLTVLKTNVDMQLNISQELDQRKKQLLHELKKIGVRERELKRKRQEQRELQKMIKDLEKYENRGL